MSREKISSNPLYGSKLNAEAFFLDNNPNGVVHATPFLDYYEAMKHANQKAFKKHQYLWGLIKDGRPVNGLIDPINDQKAGTPYLWLEVELPRSIFECRLNVLSPQMVEFFVKYQKAQISLNCTLDQLMEEAERIENGSESHLQSSSKFPYTSNQFTDQKQSEATPETDNQSEE